MLRPVYDDRKSAGYIQTPGLCDVAPLLFIDKEAIGPEL